MKIITNIYILILVFIWINLDKCWIFVLKHIHFNSNKLLSHFALTHIGDIPGRHILILIFCITIFGLRSSYSAKSHICSVEVTENQYIRIENNKRLDKFNQFFFLLT